MKGLLIITVVWDVALCGLLRYVSTFQRNLLSPSERKSFLLHLCALTLEAGLF